MIIDVLRYQFSYVGGMKDNIGTLQSPFRLSMMKYVADGSSVRYARKRHGVEDLHRKNVITHLRERWSRGLETPRTFLRDGYLLLAKVNGRLSKRAWRTIDLVPEAVYQVPGSMQKPRATFLGPIHQLSQVKQRHAVLRLR